MDIAIIGAGIGGLAAASLLADAGHKITLVERFAAPRPLGSGLVMQPVGLAVLDAIGAGDAARALGAPLTRMEGWSGRIKALDVAYSPHAPGLAIHRASLFHVLWQAMQARAVTLITDATVTAAPLQGRKRWLTLPGGPLGPFDLVVDASGAGSALSPLIARALPFGAIWGNVPWPADSPLPQSHLSQHYHRADHMAGVLPIGCLPGDPTPQAAIFWSMPTADLAQWPHRRMADWQAEVAQLWPEMARFTKGLTHTEQMTPARYSHGALKTPYQTALAFIGDAAHRASPQLGQGANMALLDALALTRALRLPLEDALPRYAQMRRWHLRLYQGLSAVLTPMYQSHSRALPLLRDHLLAPAARLWPLPRLLTALVAGDLIPPLAGVP